MWLLPAAGAAWHRVCVGLLRAQCPAQPQFHTNTCDINQRHPAGTPCARQAVGRQAVWPCMRKRGLVLAHWFECWLAQLWGCVGLPIVVLSAGSSCGSPASAADTQSQGMAGARHVCVAVFSMLLTA